MDQREHCLDVFLDLLKAFDSIIDTLLLRKKAQPLWYLR